MATVFTFSSPPLVPTPALATSYPKRELTTPEIRELMQYRLENTSNVGEIFSLGENLLSKQEWGFVQEVCRSAQIHVDRLDKTRKKREKRKAEINTLKAKLIDVHERACLTFEEELYNGLPSYLVMTEERLQCHKYSFAELMVRTVLTQKSAQLATFYRERKVEFIDDDEIDGPVVKIIDEAVSYLSSASQMMELCRVIDSNGSPKLAIPVAKKAFETQLKVREALETRAILQATIKLHEQERERLKRIKKDLPPEELSKLMLVKKELEEFVLPYTGPCSAIDINEMEKQALQLGLIMLACAVNMKKNLTTKRGDVLQKAALLTKEEQKMVNDPTILSTIVKEILLWAIPDRIKDPSHMMQLVRNTDSENQSEFLFTLGEEIRARILLLKEQIVKREKDDKELSQLQEEREGLLQSWKLLDETKSKRLHELEFRKEVDKVILPSYFSYSTDKLDNLEKGVLTWILDCIYAEKADLEDRVANPRKYPNFRQLSADQLAQRRIQFSENALRVVKDIEAPLTLFHVAKHVQAKRDSDIVFKIGNKCQKVVKDVEDLRNVRVPLQEELDGLLVEKEDMIKRKRNFSAEKDKRIQELREKIAQLPPWPEYAELFDLHQFDELSLDIVRVMMSAILDNKTTLEEEIAKMFKESSPENIDYQKIEKDRTTIQSKIQELTKQCLTKFSDPVYLLRFAKDMKSRKETGVVIEVVDKCLEKIDEINLLRMKRKPMQIRIDTLEAEKNDPTKNFTKKKEEELKRLKDDLLKLPPWPHYAQIYNTNQYSKTVHQCVDVLINSVLDQRVDYEASLSRQLYQDRTSVDEVKVGEERTQIQDRIDKALQACFTNLNDPVNLQSLIESMFARKETEIILAIVPHTLKCLDKLTTLFRNREEIVHKIAILEEEDKALHLHKKSLSKELKEDLEELKEGLELMSSEIPDFLLTAVEYDNIRNHIVTQLVSSTLEQNETLSQKILYGKDLSEERKTHFKETIEKLMKQTTELIPEVENPEALSKIIKLLAAKKHHGLALKVGIISFVKLGSIRRVREEYGLLNFSREKLLEEEAQLNKVVARLTPEKKAQLRRFEYQHRAHLQKPHFYQKSTCLDSILLELTKSLIQISKEREVALKATKEEMMDTETNTSVEQVVSTKEVVENSLQHILSVSHLIQLVKFLSSINEYGLVIISGRRTEERIFEIKKEYEEHEKLNKEYERLDNERIQFRFKDDSTASEGVEKQLKEIEQLLLTLPKFDNLKEQIQQRNAELLEVVELVIAAAKIEDDESVLREQTILAFKTDTTTKRWDQIRQIVSEEEWSRVKEELVVYVMNQDTNTQEKIQLLLKDRLFKQVLEVFPKPSGDKKELDLLMKRYFTEQSYDAVYPILDRLQRRFPSIIITLFSRAVEMVLFNITQSQYTKFVKMLSALKARMESINRHDDWNDFFQDFKKKNKGKSKLIQMVGLIGDSVWDLDSVMNTPAHKRAKIKHEPTTTSTNTTVDPPGTPDTDVDEGTSGSKLDDDDDDSDEDDDDGDFRRRRTTRSRAKTPRKRPARRK
eukprot:TRINITY_DN4505_c0_g3_i3.p1 TRINITY_DN4505_c0_g3~~TRINITY_DN4505_c0_g3_i3.p1  ORF type:complete len:1553 (-),score=439.90 TRINITY_DN4505_c0_g3_i3:108-4721(-)